MVRPRGCSLPFNGYGERLWKRPVRTSMGLVKPQGGRSLHLSSFEAPAQTEMKEWVKEGRKDEQGGRGGGGGESGANSADGHIEFGTRKLVLHLCSISTVVMKFLDGPIGSPCPPCYYRISSAMQFSSKVMFLFHLSWVGIMIPQ